MSDSIVHPGGERPAGSALEGLSPAPWSIHNATSSTIIRGADNFAVCGMARYTNRDSTRRVDANGRLIAAAPELLELLKWAPCPSSMGTASEHYERFYDWLNGPVKAAIAKAEGR